MGRPSLAEQRREEILDAYESLLPLHGLRASFKQIAAAAGMSPSIINHYFGSRAELNRAVVERSVARHREGFLASVERHNGGGKVHGLLEFMFGGEWHALCRRDFIIQELFAQAPRDKAARQVLRENFAVFESTLAELLEQSFPDADPSARAAVAYALMCLGRSNEEFLAVGFARDRNDRAMAAATAWTAMLERDSGRRGVTRRRAG